VRRDLRFEAFYPHPIEAVWAAVATRESLSRWLMPNDFEPRVGHLFCFHTKPAPGFDGTVYCEVLEVDAPNRLSFSWKGGWQRTPTTVTFTLEAVKGGTRFVLEHNDFEGPMGVALSHILERGWGPMVQTELVRIVAQIARRMSEQQDQVNPAPPQTYSTGEQHNGDQ
jgi:uncharacterized protein YndB with AHSA1/START domain